LEEVQGMTETVTIRPASREDISAIVALLQVLFSIEQDFSPDQAVQHQGLGLMLGEPRERVVLVATDKEKIIGMATMQVLVSTAQGGLVGLVEDVVVDERRRGRGVGKRLMRAVENLASEMGLSRLQLLADQDNTSALKFYAGQSWSRTNLICLRKHPGRD
jgi:ribosomal protein S18 acetylase RimI-like enzyme